MTTLTTHTCRHCDFESPVAELQRHIDVEHGEPTFLVWGGAMSDEKVALRACDDIRRDIEARQRTGYALWTRIAWIQAGGGDVEIKPCSLESADEAAESLTHSMYLVLDDQTGETLAVLRTQSESGR